MKFFCLIFLLLLLLPGGGAPANASLPMDKFGSIPVLHEGRVKPLESFAAIELEKYSQGAADLRPAAWLAETLFNPQYAAKQRIFYIGNAELLVRFKLSPRLQKLYSLEELAGKLAQTQEQALTLAAGEEDLTPDQQAFVTLHENALAYGQLLQAMTMFLPMQAALPDSSGISATYYVGLPNYFDLQKYETVLVDRVQAILDRKGDQLESYTPEEKALTTIAFQYELFKQAVQNSTIFQIIPAPGQKDEWLSPAAFFNQTRRGPEQDELMALWQELAVAYHKADAQAWEKAADHARETAIRKSGAQSLSTRLKTEIFYNKIQPFKLAFALYGLAFMLGGFFLFYSRTMLQKAAFISLAGGAAIHLCGIVMRVMILERPPVGSLYESLLFVSLIIPLVAAFLESRRKDGFSLLAAAAASLLILFIAPVVAPQGDDLEVLVAVLNTGFWLSTHVLCITAGYGMCILSAVMAHIWLWRAGNRIGRSQNGLSRNIYILSLIALLLTATGTILGGIWADQSWGRFWGWDPKENGALLIVLWLIWLHHGRLGDHLDVLAFHAGMAGLNIIVALAWFGVNLLNVGLHSYGFISGIATGLAAFCSLEVAIISVLYYKARQKRRGQV